MYMWSVFVRIQTVCAGYFYPTGDEPKVTRDVGPNITGQTGGLVGYNENASGCFERSNAGSATLPPGTLVTHAELNFNAQLANPIYNGGTTVQPSSLQALACIKT